MYVYGTWYRAAPAILRTGTHWEAMESAARHSLAPRARGEGYRSDRGASAVRGGSAPARAPRAMTATAPARSSGQLMVYGTEPRQGDVDDRVW